MLSAAQKPHCTKPMLLKRSSKHSSQIWCWDSSRWSTQPVLEFNFAKSPGSCGSMRAFLPVSSLLGATVPVEKLLIGLFLPKSLY